MSVVSRSSIRLGMPLLGAILIVSGVGSPSGQASDGAPPQKPRASRTTAEEPDDAAKDRARFQGVWKCTRLEMFGREVPRDPQDPTQSQFGNVVYDGDIYSFVEDNGKQSDPVYKVRWTPSVSRKQIDFEGIPERETLAGIYKLEGDKLTLCLTIDKNTPIRPTQFTTKEGLPLMLYFYERVKGALPPGTKL